MSSEDKTERGFWPWTKLYILALLALGPSSNCICADVARNEARREVIRERVLAYEFAATQEHLFALAREKLPNFRRDKAVVQGNSLSSPLQETGAFRDNQVLTVFPASKGNRIEIWQWDHVLQERNWSVLSTERASDREIDLYRRATQFHAPLIGSAADGATVYRLSRDDLWFEISGVFRHPEGLPGGPHESNVVETVMREPTEGFEQTRHRITLTPDSGGFRVEITRLNERTSETPSWRPEKGNRLLGEELDLIAAFDPTTGTKIREDARQAGQEAYDRAVDRGALTCAGCNRGCDRACSGCGRACDGCARDLVPGYSGCSGCQECGCR